jgi:hypothetical protein
MVSSVSGGRLNAVEMSNHCHTRHPNRAEFAGTPEVNLVDIDLNDVAGCSTAQPAGPQRFDRLERGVELALAEFLGGEGVVIHAWPAAWTGVTSARRSGDQDRHEGQRKQVWSIRTQYPHVQ